MLKHLGFTIESHTRENLTSLQSAERISEFFSKVSREYEPLSLDKLPIDVSSFLTDSLTPCLPVISEYDVCKRFQNMKNPIAMLKGKYTQN